MTRSRTHRRLAIALVTLVALAGGTAPARAASDDLAHAKELYEAASYEEALQLLDALHIAAPEADTTDVEAYRVFCLVALGRSTDAKRAIEAIVKAEPLYHPSEAQVSPRVRAFFEDVRRPLLSDIVRQSYGRAKDAFEHHDMPLALAGFDRVIALLDEMAANDDPSLTDLRTLAAGFRDLSKAGGTAAPKPAPAPPAPSAEATQSAAGDPGPSTPPPAPSTAPSTAAADPQSYSSADEDVQPPVAISQPLPQWFPENPIEERRTFRGSLDLLIAEDGRVLSATVTKSVHPKYDAVLLKAAQDWKFRPATKDGKPVRYHYTMAVQLGR